MIGKFWPTLSDERIRHIVKHTVEGGINWFDTAEVYGGGQSERALTLALETLQIAPEDAYIATKWWPLLRSSRSLEETIKEREELLKGRKILLYQIHQPYSRSTIPEQMKAMARLIDQGHIEHAGVSNFSCEQMEQAFKELKSHGHLLVSNQVRYNLMDRQIEVNGILQKARELGITIIAYSPLAQGLLSGKFHARTARVRGMRRLDPRFWPKALQQSLPLIEKLQSIAQANEASAAQVALNWLVTAPDERVMAIPGATSVEQASQNAAAMQWRLSASDRSALDHWKE